MTKKAVDRQWQIVNSRNKYLEDELHMTSCRLGHTVQLRVKDIWENQECFLIDLQYLNYDQH